MLYSCIGLLKNDQHYKRESWQIRNKRLQQRRVRTVETVLTTTVPSSTVGPIIGQSISLTTRVLRECSVKGTDFSYDQECTAVSNDENTDENILRVK